MADLRIVTWNSGGESDGRGAALVNAAMAINAQFPGTVPVQVVVTQEANVGAGGSIAAALGGNPLVPLQPFNHFINPPEHVLEHLPPAQGQRLRVGTSKAYLLGWMNTHPMPALNLFPAVGAVAPDLVDLDPAGDPQIRAWIRNQTQHPLTRTQLTQAAANMRWPVYQRLTYAGRTIHLFTWHVELRAQWLGANILGNIVNVGLPEAFIFLQQSTFWTNMITALGPNDLVVVAGDLNATGPEMANPLFFRNFQGVHDGLTHILAFSRNRALRLLDPVSYGTAFPPHSIVSARINW